MTRQSHMERKIPRDRKHPQSSNKRAIKKGPIQAAPSEVKPKPPATPPPSQAHLHSAEEACHCQLIQKLMTWITVLPLRGSHSFEEKQLFPDGSLGKALFKGSPQQWLGSHTWKGKSPETEKHPQSSKKGQKHTGPIRAAPSKAMPLPLPVPASTQAHLHSAEEACHCQLIQKLMTWITVLQFRGSHSFEVKQLFPDGSLGKAQFKGSPQQ